VKVVEQTPEQLEILIEIPRFIVWFMVGPIGCFGGLFTLALLLGGEIVNALTTGLVIAAVVTGGRYFLTQRTRLWLDARENAVRILRTTMFDAKRHEFALDHLESAEVQQSRRHGGRDEGVQRATSTLQLVFNNTRPAPRVPLNGWAVSGGGAGMLANAINDWLRGYRGR
jgi:hypothetical protein